MRPPGRAGDPPPGTLTRSGLPDFPSRPTAARRLYRRLKDFLSTFAERQRLQMSNLEALPQLTLIGLLAGLLTGAVVIGFLWLIATSQTAILPSATEDDFESLAPLSRVLLIMAGAVVIGAVLHALRSPRLGVIHVIERLQSYQGRLPLLNTALQFMCAAVGIICGHSIGREGPTIHLGAGTASLLAQRLGLPNNSNRTLVGCGIAAAIAAGFNTPLAGVILAMEVVLMEYTIAGFLPIILAAVSAAALSRIVYGHEAIFLTTQWQWNVVGELPYILAMGVVIGVLAGSFTWLITRCTSLTNGMPIFRRVLLGGVAVALVALFVPEVMGIGYDTVHLALNGKMLLGSVIVITLAKLLATGLCLGLGNPGGLIGPTIVIGSTAGAMCGLLVNALFGANVSTGFYAILGMGAMMGAVLQAPLAALLALLELTASPNAIMPAMAAVVTATMMASTVMRQGPIYRLILRSGGLDIRNDPLRQALSRVGVARAMNRSIIRVGRRLNRDTASQLLAGKPQWLLIEDADTPQALLLPADLARYIEEHEAAGDIDLLEIPAQRLDLAPTSVLASVQDAVQVLDQSGKQALYVTGGVGAGQQRIYGVLTREDIDRAYRHS